MRTRLIPGLMIAITLFAQTAAPPAPGTKAGTPPPSKAGVAASGQTTQPTLDKPALEAYLRHVLMWPATVEMTLADPTPGPMPGYFLLRVHGASGNRSQDEVFYVSADSQIVIHGDVFDVRKNPFQADMDRMKTDGQPFLGSPGAPVQVVEFSDFQCPYCKQESGVVRTKLLEAYPKDVQIFFMDYPLEPIHPWARGAAILGRCIYSQNNASFWGYHDWIFEHQSEITPENLKEKVTDYAKSDKNLDAANLAACAVSPGVREEVDRTETIGDSLKLSATPTLFINGRRMVGTIPLDDLKLVIDHEIAYAKTAKKDSDCCSVQLSLPGLGKVK
jgi:protein-disulfide isomerase